MESIIHHLPGWDLENGMLRAWWFEPLVATLSFAFAIHVYWYEERKRGLSRCKRLVMRNLAKELWAMDTNDIYNSLGAYWLGIYLLKCVIAAAKMMAGGDGKKNVVADGIPDGIPTDINSAVYVASEVVAGIVMYDALFFFVHWGMHDLPFLRKIHFYHHCHGASSSSSSSSIGNSLEARDVLRHSFVDGSLQVLCNILVQQFNPWGGPRKSRCARAAHNVVLTWMLTESHTASPTPNVSRRFFVGVREHRLHHLEGGEGSSSCGEGMGSTPRIRRHQQLFGYLDSLRTWIDMQRCHLAVLKRG